MRAGKPVLVVGVQTEEHYSHLLICLWHGYEIGRHPHFGVWEDVRDRHVLMFDMTTMPERGDVIDHLSEGSAVVTHHVYCDGPELYPGHYYDRRNRDLPALCAHHRIPLFMWGDRPVRPRPTSQFLAMAYFAP